jgi:hypothetical protein
MAGDHAPSRHVALDGAVNVRDIDSLEVSEAMLTGLRRALLGDLVPPEPCR